MRRLAPAVFACAALQGACAPAYKKPLHACSVRPALDNYRGPDAIRLGLRIENKMGTAFHPADVCVEIDGGAVRQESPDALTSGLAARRPLEIRALLRPGVEHRVVVVVRLDGRGSIKGCHFVIRSEHRVEVSESLLVVELIELERGPIEERPWVRWTSGNAARAP